MKNKYQPLKYIPFALFGLTTFVLSIIDKNNSTAILIFSAISAIPFFNKIFKFFSFNAIKNSNIIDVFYFSIFLFYIGYFFSLMFHSNSKPVFLTNGLAFVIVIALYIIMLFSIFVYWALSKGALADNYYEFIKTKEHIAIKEFLNVAKEKEANVLAVAGNLKSLNSKDGLKLLIEFLNNNPVNKLELFIPISAKQILIDLKKKLNNDALANRVEVNVVEPFVFLQGIVFAGQKINTQPIPLTKGYYLYKPIVQEGEPISKGGIFIDVSEFTDENDDYSIAIGAYYNHLKNKIYPVNGYEFIPGIFKVGDKLPHNHIIETFTLDTV